MRLNIKHFPSILLLLAFTAVCREQSVTWQGTIEVLDCVTVVHNPRTPLYGEGACSLEEEFSIGTADGPEEYMLTSIMDMAVDGDGHIYVADMKGNHVRVFDQEGKYVRTIGGGRGQGPGEFMMLRGIQLTRDHKLRALDRMTGTLSEFTLDGSFLESTLIRGVTGTIITTCSDFRDRNYIESVKMGAEGRLMAEIDVYDPDFNLLAQIATKEIPQTVVQSGLVWYLVDNDFIIYGDNESYEINILDSDFRPARKITKIYDPVEVRKDEVEGRIARPLKPSEELPRFYPAYGHISVDDEGRIYVQTWETTEALGYYYDVFDAEGRYITRFVFKYQDKPIWKNGRVYTKESDDDRMPLVTCYRVSWNY